MHREPHPQAGWLPRQGSPGIPEAGGRAGWVVGEWSQPAQTTVPLPPRHRVRATSSCHTSPDSPHT